MERKKERQEKKHQKLLAWKERTKKETRETPKGAGNAAGAGEDCK